MDARNGQPIIGAIVAIESGPGRWPDVAQVTGTDGRFDLEATAVGEYRIGVRASGYVGRSGTDAVPMIADAERPAEIALEVK